MLNTFFKWELFISLVVPVSVFIYFMHRISFRSDQLDCPAQTKRIFKTVQFNNSSQVGTGGETNTADTPGHRGGHEDDDNAGS